MPSWKNGTIVRIRDDKGLPPLLAGHYAEVQSHTGGADASYTLRVESWSTNYAVVDYPSEWLEELPPEEAARFTHAIWNWKQIPALADPGEALQIARRTIESDLRAAFGKGLRGALWHCRSFSDLLDSYQRELERVTGDTLAGLENAWDNLVEAEQAMHRAVMAYVGS